VIDLNGDTATGTQPLCFIDNATHDMRIGYYKDNYVRTDDGWRLKTRAMTFIRRSGVHDSGRPHAVGRPRPTTMPAEAGGGTGPSAQA
jgi:SnoaL-like domain